MVEVKTSLIWIIVVGIIFLLAVIIMIILIAVGIFDEKLTDADIPPNNPEPNPFP